MSWSPQSSRSGPASTASLAQTHSELDMPDPASLFLTGQRRALTSQPRSISYSAPTGQCGQTAAFSIHTIHIPYPAAALRFCCTIPSTRSTHPQPLPPLFSPRARTRQSVFFPALLNYIRCLQTKPMGQIRPPPVFASTVLLEHSHIPSLIDCGHFHVIAELSTFFFFFKILLI